jgi:hypothetical protein
MRGQTNTPAAAVSVATTMTSNVMRRKVSLPPPPFGQETLVSAGTAPTSKAAPTTTNAIYPNVKVRRTGGRRCHQAILSSVAIGESNRGP